MHRAGIPGLVVGIDIEIMDAAGIDCGSGNVGLTIEPDRRIAQMRIADTDDGCDNMREHIAFGNADDGDERSGSVDREGNGSTEALVGGGIAGLNDQGVLAVDKIQRRTFKFVIGADNGNHRHPVLNVDLNFDGFDRTECIGDQRARNQRPLQHGAIDWRDHGDYRCRAVDETDRSRIEIFPDAGTFHVKLQTQCRQRPGTGIEFQRVGVNLVRRKRALQAPACKNLGSRIQHPHAQVLHRQCARIRIFQTQTHLQRAAMGDFSRCRLQGADQGQAGCRLHMHIDRHRAADIAGGIRCGGVNRVVAGYQRNRREHRHARSIGDAIGIE